ncbi:MAG TPA: NHL repeat-containing protein [Solirubrobacterales bacterium]|nr:NHL repeat-containing protein [Solirubrobacterales bacterium]
MPVSGRAPRLRLLILLVICASALWAPSEAGAVIGPKLTEFGEEGSGAGQILFPRGIAADPDTGHLFITDAQNNRISEFTAWGEFVKVWGWGVADGSEELQTCTAADAKAGHECLAGIAGEAAGQLRTPGGIAVAENGDVYVFELENRRVQAFSPEGDFLRMFGGDVNKTLGAPNPDVCTAAELEAGGECGAGVEGTGPSEYSDAAVGRSTFRDLLDIVSGTVYVGDRNRIQEFELDGTFKTEIPLPNPGEASGLWIDRASGDIYFVYGAGPVTEPVPALRLSPAGALVYELPEKKPSEEGTWTPAAVTSDPDGNVFLAQGAAVGPEDGGSVHPGVTARLLEIDPSGEIVDSCCSPPVPVGSGVANVELPAVTTNVVTTAGDADLYIVKRAQEGTSVEVRGPAPDKWPPPLVPPEIVGQFAASLDTDSAVLQAEINPEFWGDTHYYLEYGTSECRLGGCSTAPVPPGNLLGGGSVKLAVTTEPIELPGLDPATTYHYRFVAASGGGGPVYGEDPDGNGPEEPTFEDGMERTFTTFAPETSPPECPENQAFRTGVGAKLPDCRAYELVSPLEKFGGDIAVQTNILVLPAKLDQSAPSGDKLTYTSYRAFADPVGAGYQSQYLSTRTAAGWATENLSPPLEGPPAGLTSALDAPYKAFREDLSVGWLRQDYEPVLAPGGVPGYPNLYRNVLGEGYEAVTTGEPSSTTPTSLAPEVQGFSADGRRTVFAATGKLTANASASEISQVYESFEGNLKLVSVRPNGSASTVKSSAGSSELGGLGTPGGNRAANVTHAVSANGSRIYWSEGAAGSGKVYVRVGGTKTTPVSAGAAIFWAANPDGSAAIYTEAGALKRFDLSTASSTTLVGASVGGVVGESEDLSRIYFVATDELAAGAVAGRPNLYLYEAGQPLTLVAVLSAADTTTPPRLSVDSVSPMFHAARVTPSGETVIFMSRAAPSGADTKDAASGKQDAEVYRWDVSARQLRCVSCPPGGARPSGQELLFSEAPTGYWFASAIPGWELQLYAPRALSRDGSRVFFESTSPLVLADTNKHADVYEWEAPSSGKCSEENPYFSARSGGCVFLISGGEEPTDSHFVDADADGSDVFFTTSQSLVSSDPDLIDIYDARVGGGFAIAPEPEECEGEGCQPVAPAPPVPPAQSSQAGPGNRHYPPKCKKGFVRKHGKCVKKKKRHHHKSHHKGGRS